MYFQHSEYDSETEPAYATISSWFDSCNSLFFLICFLCRALCIHICPLLSFCWPLYCQFLNCTFVPIWYQIFIVQQILTMTIIGSVGFLVFLKHIRHRLLQNVNKYGVVMTMKSAHNHRTSTFCES